MSRYVIYDGSPFLLNNCSVAQNARSDCITQQHQEEREEEPSLRATKTLPHRSLSLIADAAPCKTPTAASPIERDHGSDRFLVRVMHGVSVDSEKKGKFNDSGERRIADVFAGVAEKPACGGNTK